MLALASSSSATPASTTHLQWADKVVKHAWDDIPRGWTYESTPSPDHTFDLHIGLKQAGIEELISHLMEISDPSHPRYGQHLTQSHSESLASCHPSSLSTAHAWLASYSIPPSIITHTRAGGDWLSLRQIRVADAQALLENEYHVYRHDATGERVLRALSYSLPRELMKHVDVVAPTTYFSTLKTMRRMSFLEPDVEDATTPHRESDVDSLTSSSSPNRQSGVVDGASDRPTTNRQDVPISPSMDLEPVEDVESLVDPVLSHARIPAGCARTITPACLRAMYNTTGYRPTQMGRNKLGAAGYLGEYANQEDLQTFLKKFRSDAVGATFPTVQINGGGNDQTKPGIEANLDIQYTIGMSYPTPNIYYSTGGTPPFTKDSTTSSNTNEPYLEWITYMLSQNQTDLPQVITTSYGDDEQTVPREYAIRVCNMFAQLGARGVTMFFSSGDFGVGGGDCHMNDGTERTMFQPAFPASCPYITSVGGTTSQNPERGVSFSGGGFSAYFARPAYQDSAVEGYLGGMGAQYSGMYNASGRAYPDLSAQASRFQVVVGGMVVSVGGTSASSPTVAGLFALLNDFRLSRNLSALGFINPLLYSLNLNTTGSMANGEDGGYEGFNDIVEGSNPGCGTEGFKAGRGWDPVTGVGTPDFVKLQAVVGDRRQMP